MDNFKQDLEIKPASQEEIDKAYAEVSSQENKPYDPWSAEEYSGYYTDNKNSEPETESVLEKNNKKKNRLKVLGASALVGVTLAASAIGISVFGNSQKAEATPTNPTNIEDTQASHNSTANSEKNVNNSSELKEPTTSSSVDNDQKETSDISNQESAINNNSQTVETKTAANESIENIPTVESLEIDGSLLETDPVGVLNTFYEKLFIEGMGNSGATEENAKKALKSPDGFEDYMSQVAAEYNPVYIQAFFAGENDLSSNSATESAYKGRLAAGIKSLEKVHEDVLTYYAATSSPDINGELYKLSGEITEVSSVTNVGGDIFIDFSIKQTDNRPSAHYKIATGEERPFHVTFRNINGKAKVIDIIDYKPIYENLNSK